MVLAFIHARSVFDGGAFTIKSAGQFYILAYRPDWHSLTPAWTVAGNEFTSYRDAADLMAPMLSTGMLVGVSTAPAGMPQPLMAPHKAAVCTLFHAPMISGLFCRRG